MGRYLAMTRIESFNRSNRVYIIDTVEHRLMSAKAEDVADKLEKGEVVIDNLVASGGRLEELDVGNSIKEEVEINGNRYIISTSGLELIPDERNDIEIKIAPFVTLTINKGCEGKNIIVENATVVISGGVDGSNIELNGCELLAIKGNCSNLRVNSGIVGCVQNKPLRYLGSGGQIGSIELNRAKIVGLPFSKNGNRGVKNNRPS